MVADNIFFEEETLSGQGTTHHTNCLPVQVLPGPDETTGDRSEYHISKRLSTLKRGPREGYYKHYAREQRAGPQQFLQREGEFSLESG